jgi:hypothetical protein
MKPVSLAANEARWQFGLLLGSALLFAWLVARSWQLYPVVFADEWLYSSFSRLTPLKDATIPSYLYLSIFGLSNACGDGFLGCVRVLNCLFFAGAAPFYYLAARQLAGRPVALAVALMSLLLPVGSYTAYFMPESLYFFGFAVLTWAAIGHRPMHWARHAVVTGAILGLMTLVKVHALFLIPSLCLFNAFVGWSGRRVGVALASMALTLTAALAIKFTIGYAVAGQAGLHLLGSFYGDSASGTLGAGARLLKLVPTAVTNAWGHLMSVVALFALPVAVTLHSLLSPAARARTDARLTALQLYTVLMLGAAMAMTVLFTASISEYGPGEGLRLHMRYYSFAFPLLLLVAGAAMDERQGQHRGALGWVLAALLAIVLLVSLVDLPTYQLSMIDGPDVAAIVIEPHAGTALVGLELLIVLLWAAGRRGAAVLFLFLLMPLWLLYFNIALANYWKQVRKPGGFDSAGMLVHDYVKKSERKDVMVAGTNLVQLLRAKFHIDDTGVGLLDLPDGAPFESGMTPGNRKWLLVVGNHKLPPDLKPVVEMPREYALIKLDNSHRKIASANFFGPLDTDVITRVEGLSYPESWGRWSDGKLVTLHFTQPLPERLHLIFTGQAFGPNVAQKFKLRVGSAEASFRLAAMPEEAFVRMHTDGLQKTLTIEVPHPVAPHSLGDSVDVRTLGLGLISIEVGTPAD